MTISIPAEPYDFTFDPAATALLIIDMQRDFVDSGGFGELLGNNVAPLREVIAPIGRVLAAWRARGLLAIHTREGHRPDMIDCPPNKLWRSQRIGAGIGDPGPMGRILVRGEWGHDIVDELAPAPGEPVIDKPGKGSFYATDLSGILAHRGIRSLIVAGVTTEVCVHTTVRDANDRGYECLLLEDCTGATNYGNYQGAINMIKMQGGVFGTVSRSEALIAALAAQSF